MSDEGEWHTSTDYYVILSLKRNKKVQAAEDKQPWQTLLGKRWIRTHPWLEGEAVEISGEVWKEHVPARIRAHKEPFLSLTAAQSSPAGARELQWKTAEKYTNLLLKWTKLHHGVNAAKEGSREREMPKHEEHVWKWSTAVGALCFPREEEHHTAWPESAEMLSHSKQLPCRPWCDQHICCHSIYPPQTPTNFKEPCLFFSNIFLPRRLLALSFILVLSL